MDLAIPLCLTSCGCFQYKSLSSMRNLFLILIFSPSFVYSQLPAPFVSSPLTDKGNLSSLMVDGIRSYLDNATVASEKKRAELWHVDFSGKEVYDKSIAPNREHLARIIGVVDQRNNEKVMEYVSTTDKSAKVIETEYFVGYLVRWPVLGEIHGEGLLLQPKGPVKSRVVAVPDADQTPEMLVGIMPGLSSEKQYARRLAENGCQVIIPEIIDRSCKWSGSPRLNLYTNQPHREWIYRQAYTFGRHIIGYEVQKLLAAIDWFVLQKGENSVRIGVTGWGEGALLGFYSAAIDNRINAVLVSGYFARRENLWKEPIYRNISGLLREFGDAEIASLIAPRSLIIEFSNHPRIDGPPEVEADPVSRRKTAAPGRIVTPEFEDVSNEVERAKRLTGPFSKSIQLIHNNRKATDEISDVALKAFLKQLQPEIKDLKPLAGVSQEIKAGFDPAERQHRQLIELENHIQKLIVTSRYVREDFFWNKLRTASPEIWKNDKHVYQDYFWNEVIGRIPEEQVPINPRSRIISDNPSWTGYEVTLDVSHDIFVWGYLLLPKNIKQGEKRPVLVVQHGLSGVPAVMMDENNKTYKALAVKLVEKGYIVFAPHFPWLAADNYRNLQRKANPLGLTIFSIILNQHQRILDWLSYQSWVDTAKIGFYGLSWGGKVAVRIPSLLNRYSLTVCSGDFNEWIWKNATTDWPGSYMFSPEYEMFDFNLGMTFNYGEMAAMIAPRAFMVERGHNDGVGIDEMIAFEYSKVKRFYDKLNIPEMTEIEYFNGVHEINAIGTMAFIRRHFGLPQSNIR
jgi:dienelactone hydrolase